MKQETILTPVYKEAVAEVKKIKEIATENAKREIIEAMTPAIKQEIEKSLSSLNRSFLLEEEDPLEKALASTSTPPAAAPQLPGAPVTPAKQPPPPVPVPEPEAVPVPPAPAEASIPPIDSTVAPPVQPTPQMSIPLSDMGQDGKITIDLATLFNNTPEGQEPAIGAGAPLGVSETPTDPIDSALGTPLPPEASGAPVEPTTANPFEESLSYDSFKENVNKVQKKIFEGGSALVKQVQKERLFGLFEQLEEIYHRNLISDKVYKLQESKLDLLFQRVVESAKKPTTYDLKVQREEKMNSLKEFAAALFETSLGGQGSLPNTKGASGFEDKTSPKTDEGKDDARAKAAGSHAEKVSDSRPVEDPDRKEGIVKEELDEVAVLEAELKELFGLDDDNTKKEPSVSEASPGVAKVVGDPVSKGMNKVSNTKGGPAVIEVADKELKKEALKLRQENLLHKMNTLKEEEKKIKKALKECGLPEVAFDGAGEIPDLPETESGKDVQDISIHADTVNINIDETGSSSEEDLSGVGGLDDLEDDDEIVISDEEEPTASEPTELPSKEEEEELPEGKKVNGKIMKENKELKVVLEETKLLTARSLYANKFFVRDNLSRNQKRKIVEYLDTAQTVEEAKTIYRRIKKILDESAKNKTEVKPENKAGSSSSKSSSGSAANLNESVENRNSSGVTKERFMALAGIKKKDK